MPALKGPLPDGTCQFVGGVNQPGWGVICKKHNDRLQKYGDPYSTPFRPNDEPRKLRRAESTAPEPQY